MAVQACRNTGLFPQTRNLIHAAAGLESLDIIVGRLHFISSLGGCRVSPLTRRGELPTRTKYAMPLEEPGIALGLPTSYRVRIQGIF